MLFPYTKPLVIVDVETTGGNADSNRLIEIGIIRIENGKEVSRFQSLVNPRQSVPPFVQRLTGITDRALETAPVFEDIAGEVEAQLKDALFIGHNVRFDYDFVRYEFRRLSKRFLAPTLCSARLSRALFPGHKRHNLKELIERHGLTIESHHRALDDAQAVWDFMRKAAEETGAQRFAEVFGKLEHGRPVQTLIAPEKFENLPESCGVYAFHAAGGKTLYVGKSNNLREKVLGHFYGDFEGPRELQITAEAVDFEWRETPGEISALFLEAEWLEKFAPQHAKKNRKTSRQICAARSLDAEGYMNVRLCFEDEMQEGEQVIAYYRGFRDAKQVLAGLADKFKLCRRKLDLEKGSGPCAGFSIRKCSGSCAGKESPEEYALRIDRAFRESGVESWPYPSAVLLEEKNDATGETESYLIQNWILLARIRGGKTEKLSEGFDWDRFKILKRALQGGRGRPLSPQELREYLAPQPAERG